MPDQGNAKRAVFWDWTWFSRITIWGQSMPIFKKKGTFLKFYMGAFGVIFQNSSIPPNMFPKKILFRVVKLDANLHKIPEGGFSSLHLKRTNLDKGMFWKPLVTHVYNTSIRVLTLPVPSDYLVHTYLLFVFFPDKDWRMYHSGTYLVFWFFLHNSFFTIKGALDKYNIYHSISYSIEDINGVFINTLVGAGQNGGGPKKIWVAQKRGGEPKSFP